jgi:hypothetical protein
MQEASHAAIAMTLEMSMFIRYERMLDWPELTHTYLFPCEINAAVRARVKRHLNNIVV